jgi:hypothetical protein
MIFIFNNIFNKTSIICLFESSTYFEKLCAHPQEDNCMNTTSGIITLKISEWSKITKIHAYFHLNNALQNFLHFFLAVHISLVSVVQKSIKYYVL